MSRPVEIETLQRQLAEVTRKLAKLESQRAETYQRRKRTRELIQLGATARKSVPEITPEELERVIEFVQERFIESDNEKNQNYYQDWKESYLERKK